MLFNTLLLFQNHAHAFRWKRGENRPYHGTERTRNNKGQEWPPHSCGLKLQGYSEGVQREGCYTVLNLFYRKDILHRVTCRHIFISAMKEKHQLV